MTLAFSNTTITLRDFSANQLVVNFVGGVGFEPCNLQRTRCLRSPEIHSDAIASVTGLPFANVTEPGDQLALNWITSSLTFLMAAIKSW